MVTQPWYPICILHVRSGEKKGKYGRIFFQKKNVHSSWRLGICKWNACSIHISSETCTLIKLDRNCHLKLYPSYNRFKWNVFKLFLGHGTFIAQHKPFVTTEMYAAKALMISGHIFLYCFFLCLSLTTQTDMPTASTIFHVYPYTSAKMTGKELYKIYTFFWKAACHVWCGPVTSPPSLLCI